MKLVFANGTEYGTVDYQGYTTLLSVSNIAAPTMFAKSVRLGQAQ